MNKQGNARALLIGTLILGLIFTETVVYCQGIVQATIHKNDKTSIEVLIQKIGVETVEYRLWEIFGNNRGAYGPLREIHKREIWRIDYESGRSETFPEFQTTQPSTPVQQQTGQVIKPSYSQKPKSQSKQYRQTPAQEPTYTSENQSSESKVLNEEQNTGFSHKGFCFGGKAGLFIPYDQNISKIYGTGFMGGLLIGYWEGLWGFEVDWRGYSNKGDPYTFGQVDYSTSQIFISPLTLTGYYNVYKKGNLETYVGLGVGPCFIQEDLTWTAFGTTESASVNFTAFEIHSTGGIRFAPFYIEASFLSISHSDYNKNSGGLLISGGIFF